MRRLRSRRRAWASRVRCRARRSRRRRRSASSTNTTNRSMGFDTELGLAWEAPAPTDSLRAARIDLMREHAGLTADEAAAILRDPTDLVARLDDLARRGHHRLRIHNRNVDE